ncbi:hypothetical protein F8154_05480 [Alkaliphilus pronyensis]|uniref:Uncharacterized protein n=1 Tax=Alkaliphilus pronyensis TaxID=1482732 RepID=A0A6I0F357_9FIRM|nr:hypothetical protein [Alkaliphilus pronyensis]KAB3535752.1 hypothetical protein F8154_05480 [Alkaliphilus pronyensis]
MRSLSIVTKSHFINNTFSFIDEEVNQYFLKIENKLLKKISLKKGLYNITKDDIVNQVTKNKDFYDMLASISETLNIEFKSHSGYVPFTLSIKDEKIVNCNFNSSLVNQYKLSHIIADKGEKCLGDVIENSLLGFYSNQLIEVIYNEIDFTDIVMDVLDVSFHSKRVFDKHNKDVGNRIKGILLNIKYRLLKAIKEQIHIYLQSAHEYRKNA